VDGEIAARTDKAYQTIKAAFYQLKMPAALAAMEELRRDTERLNWLGKQPGDGFEWLLTRLDSGGIVPQQIRTGYLFGGDNRRFSTLRSAIDAAMKGGDAPCPPTVEHHSAGRSDAPARSKEYEPGLRSRLADMAYAREYMRAALEDGDDAVFLLAVQDVAAAHSGAPELEQAEPPMCWHKTPTMGCSECGPKPEFYGTIDPSNEVPVGTYTQATHEREGDVPKGALRPSGAPDSDKPQPFPPQDSVTKQQGAGVSLDAMYDKAVEMAENDTRTTEQIVADGVNFVCGGEAAKPVPPIHSATCPHCLGTGIVDADQLPAAPECLCRKALTQLYAMALEPNTVKVSDLELSLTSLATHCPLESIADRFGRDFHGRVDYWYSGAEVYEWLKKQEKLWPTH
jgi:hypothetical protein